MLSPRFMRPFYAPAIIAIIAVFATALPAMAAVEPDYDPSKPYVTTPWYGMTNAARKDADMAFITGMRPHHAGALTMSNDYLAHAQATNGGLKQLARGIIRNQNFEIKMLDTVEQHLAALSFNARSPLTRAHIATQGLAQKYQFTRAPMPGPFDIWTSSKNVSAEDVRFAKAMIIHHEGALVMAQDYLDDENATNEYLRLMCMDILRDQKMEIAFMQDIINQYPGNPDDIKIDPSMVHGMDGMMHGDAMHHGGHH